jgi:hypothetical protein
MLSATCLRLRCVALAFLLASGVGGPSRPMEASPGTLHREITGRAAAAAPPAHHELDSHEVIRRLMEENKAREQRLQQYSVRRRYLLQDERGEMRAESEVILHYRAPSTKEFHTVSQSGSGLVGSRVFRQLLESEVESAGGQPFVDRSITLDNYDFLVVGRERLDGDDCYVVAATPKRKDKFLLAATLWVHAAEFAIIKIEGSPARNPSWWVKKTEFVRWYGKVGEFWLPRRDQTRTNVRVFGTNTLTVEYSNYQVVSGPGPGQRSCLEGWPC